MGRIKFTLGALVVLTAVFLAVAEGFLWAADGTAGHAKGETGDVWAPFSPPVGQNPLFVDLKNVNGRYVIARISNQPLMFRLNDFRPQFDIRNYRCTKIEGHFVPEVTRPEMCKDDEEKFRRVKVDDWNTMATDFVTFFLNSLRGDVETYSGFDADEYKRAVQDALQHSGLDRERVLKSYDHFLALIRDMRAKKESDYTRKLKEAQAVQFTLKIDDRSGLYKNDLAARDLVAIKPNELPAFDPKTIVFGGVDSASVEEALNKAGEAYARSLEEAASYYPLEILSVANHYNLRVDAPDRIFLKDGNRQTVALHVTVFGKNLVNVSPRYLNENDDLRMEDDGGSLVLSNKSHRFVRINALLTHYGAQVVSAPLNLDLAPGGFVSLEKTDRRLHLPRRESYHNATRDSIKGQALSFGYDVKYNVLGHQAQRSLHKVENHQVYDLVK